MRRATERLAASSSAAEMHVIEGSMHWNFVDVVCWLRPLVWLLRMLGVLGRADASQIHRDVTNLVIEFCQHQVCLDVIKTAGRP